MQVMLFGAHTGMRALHKCLACKPKSFPVASFRTTESSEFRQQFCAGCLGDVTKLRVLQYVRWCFSERGIKLEIKRAVSQNQNLQTWTCFGNFSLIVLLVFVRTHLLECSKDVGLACRAIHSHHSWVAIPVPLTTDSSIAIQILAGDLQLRTSQSTGCCDDGVLVLDTILLLLGRDATESQNQDNVMWDSALQTRGRNAIIVVHETTFSSFLIILWSIF
jgi:hypothetical protein